MTSFLQTLFVLFCVGQAFAANSCRACSGEYKVYFFDRILQDQATDFFKSVIPACATGNDYKINKTVAEDCKDSCLVRDYQRCLSGRGKQVCNTYTFSIDVYRYCGNGGKVIRDNQSEVTALGFRSTRQVLQLGCYRSVQCGGDCDKATCF